MTRFVSANWFKFRRSSSKHKTQPNTARNNANKLLTYFQIRQWKRGKIRIIIRMEELYFKGATFAIIYINYFMH